MAAECTMSNEPLSGSTASCTWCQGLKHRTPLLKQNHVVAVGPGLLYISQTVSLIHKAWVISLNLFHKYFCSARSPDPLPGLLLLWGAGRHGGVAVSGPSHPPPHTRTKPQLRLEGDAPARMTSVWSKLHPTLSSAVLPQTAAPPTILKPFLCQPLHTAAGSAVTGEEASLLKMRSRGPSRSMAGRLNASLWGRTQISLYYCVSWKNEGEWVFAALCGRALTEIQRFVSVSENVVK